MARQLSIFAENNPGRIEKITRLLSQEGINIRAITISSANGFGVIKILASEPQKLLSFFATIIFRFTCKRSLL